MKNIKRVLSLLLVSLMLLSSASVFAAEDCIEYHNDCLPCPECGGIFHYSPPCADYCLSCGDKGLPVTAEHTYTYPCSDQCTVCYGGHRHVSCVTESAPCLGGVCIYCGKDVAPTADHQYDHDYDADCNACGTTRDVTLPIRFSGNSVSEDVNGLAFLYDIDVEGMQVDLTTAIFDTATVGDYKLVGMGTIASNNGTVPTADAVEGVRVLKTPVVYLYDLVDGMATYAIRFKNIPELQKDTTIIAVPYFIIEVEGERYTVYGEAMSATYNAVANG